MYKRILISFIAVFSMLYSESGMAQTAEGGGIKWLTLQQAETAMKKKPKKIIIDIYTDWCFWCKRLDATTYQDPAVVKYINENFYAVKLNAEMKDSIVFRGSTYKYDPSYKMNTVTPQFMGNSNGYPTITFVDEKFKVINVVPGYQDANGFLKTAKFYGDNYYLNTDYNTYLSTAGGK